MGNVELYKYKFLNQRFIFLFFILFCNHTFATAQREILTINDKWKFYKGECLNAFEYDYNDSLWQNINIPHCWNEDAYATNQYYKGSAWYRRKLTIPLGWKNKEIFLKLDGVNKFCEVFINGECVGKHSGGYSAYILNITKYVLTDRSNTIAIRVDNSREDIPPFSGDFTSFGGIYRDIWLISVPYQHFNFTNYGSDATYVSTPLVSEEKGIVEIQTEIKNSLSTASNLEIIYNIYNPYDSLLQVFKKELFLKGKESLCVTQSSRSIEKPLLWSPETPNLYKVEIELRNLENHKILDRQSHYIGFRWFNFDGEKGFFLNGKPYKLRGICRHQDQKPIGYALSDEMHRRDFRLMKEMGANFIRISHYPQDESLLEMCDKEGMLVWEEIPIIDIVPEDNVYQDNCVKNLKEMVYQHRNHSSIIIWGYMNEILLKYKEEKGTKPVLNRTLNLARKLEQSLKSIDPTRMSAMAFHGTNLYNETHLSGITDVVGWNLYSGWYGGDLIGFEEFLKFQQKNYPNNPVIVSEYGAGSDNRLHSLYPKAFDFSIEYQQCFLEHYLPILEETPYVSGGAHWNLVDFSSAQRGESMPHINNKGLLYNNRIPKDVYYYYQAMWRRDIPVLYVASRDWTHRTLIQKDTNSCCLPIKVYSNLPEVELFLDGKSIGKKKVKNCTAIFYVSFFKKQHFIHINGVYNGQKIEDGLPLYFSYIPYVLSNANTNNLELAINVGSDCFFTSDESQLTWVPDQPYHEGSWGYIGGKIRNTQTEITQTADVPLYQSLREDIDGYRFDLSEGTYELELLFTDINEYTAQNAYLLKKGNIDIGNQNNCFDILVNDTIIDEDFEPSQNGGYFQAVKKRYIIHNKEKYILLTFKNKRGKNFLSGIKIRRL